MCSERDAEAALGVRDLLVPSQNRIQKNCAFLRCFSGKLENRCLASMAGPPEHFPERGPSSGWRSVPEARDWFRCVAPEPDHALASMSDRLTQRTEGLKPGEASVAIIQFRLPCLPFSIPSPDEVLICRPQ